MDKFLYEIIEDYIEVISQDEKDKLFDEFCSAIWNSQNKRRTYIKTIKFKVRDDLLDTDVGKIFNTWSIVEYRGYKSTSSTNDWYDLIKQKINNLYTRYFDKEVILNKEYMDLLKTPKNLYFRLIKGYAIDTDNLNEHISSAISDAQVIKLKFQKQKMELSWDDYRKLIEDILRKIFDSCMTIDEYELKYGISNNVFLSELATEDNFYIKYICRSLETHMRNYQKEYYGLKRGRNKRYIRCKECGALIEKTSNCIKYCKDCAIKVNREKTKNNMKNIRKCSV